MTARLLLAGLCAGIWGTTSAQFCVWAEEFENGCATGCYAANYSSSPNGAWTVVNTGTNGNCANRWYVSCAENGNLVGACGTGCGQSETLHIGNAKPATCASPNGCLFCPTGDCGAAYDAGCPPAICSLCCNCNDPETDSRATSPVIDLTGYGPIILNLKYIENGQGLTDNATLWYFDGATWSQLADLPKTAVCAGGQGLWTNFSTALPVSAWNNSNVRIGFRWINNNDGAGSDPSFAVDDVQMIVPYAPLGTGLIVNELSNGPTGNKEYIELLAVGPQCSTIDIRLTKVDDNNGVMYNGFANTMVNSGVASGHLRFSNNAAWAAVPTGSLILLYNETDLNALLPGDDPADSSPIDSVYILPSNHALMQGCGTRPDPAITSGYYNTCVWGGGNWNYISLRNEGDAAQTRDAAGGYFHGISYGTDGQNMNPGGLDNLRISATDHTNKVIFFNTGNYRLAANFTSALTPGTQTPGAPNNALNAAYIAQFRCEILPVELVAFTAIPLEDRVRLHWTTATEANNAYFEVQRSSDGSFFTTIGIVNGAGHSMLEQQYVHDDIAPVPGMNYYRLRQVDFDGRSAFSPVRPVRWNILEGAQAWVDVDDLLHVIAPAGPGDWILMDALGRAIEGGALDEEGRGMADASLLPAGCYTVMLLVDQHQRGIRVMVP